MCNLIWKQKGKKPNAQIHACIFVNMLHQCINHNHVETVETEETEGTDY